MKYSDFLFELGVEELPSKAVLTLSKSLAENVRLGLDDAKIEHGEILSFGTPRRLAIIVKNVAHLQASQIVSKRGPAVNGSMDKDNNPLPSLLGFAKSCNVDVKDLKTIKTEKGEWWLFESDVDGLPTRELLFSLVQEAISKLPIAKLMTWGEGKYHFSRPVHWSLMLFGDEIIRGDMFGTTTGELSYGHRFHHPQAIKISKIANYVEELYSGKVIADFAIRRSIILEQLQALADKYNVTPIVSDDLLDEVTSIVEWPCAVFADFSADFLQIPEEVIIESLQHHQKCFAVKNLDGKLAPHFITIANIESTNPNRVKIGNEKVVRARLSDAAFFYKQDAKQSLESYAPNLEKVVFHAKLGSVAEKVLRVSKLTQYLIEYFSLDTNLAERAAFLSKCDLLTGMVGEFPELQGTMGCYYAQHDAEPEEVCLAIKEQYYPRFSGDDLPSSAYGLALSIADRIDTLVGLFALGQKPSGVKDPYKLRRHALAIVRMLLIVPKDISLKNLINTAIDGFKDKIIINREELFISLSTFIYERMLSFYQVQSIDSQYFHAVKASQADYLLDLDLRVKALLKYKDIPDAESLSAACKRVDNILTGSNISLNATKVFSELFIAPAEQQLLFAVVDLETKIETLLKSLDYSLILQKLASIKKPVDDFFDNVMVMVEDPKIKENRLNLLLRLQNLLKTVADIALIHDFSA